MPRSTANFFKGFYMPSELEKLNNIRNERDCLTRSIHEAAIEAGICNADGAVDAPLLMMLCGDMKNEILRLRALLKEYHHD